MVALVATCGPGNTYVNRPFEGTKTVRLGFLSRIPFVRSLQLPKTEQPLLPLSDAPGAGEKQSVQGSRQSLLHGFKPVKTEGGPVLTGSIKDTFTQDLNWNSCAKHPPNTSHLKTNAVKIRLNRGDPASSATHARLFVSLGLPSPGHIQDSSNLS